MILTEARSSELAERIRNAVEGALLARNISARRASLDVVGHDGLIRDIRAGRIPSADRVEALFSYLGLEAYFGPQREAVKPPGLRLVTNLSPDDDAPVGFLTIPWVEAGVSKGSAPVAFSRAWLTQHALAPDFLAVAAPDTVVSITEAWDDHLALLDTRVSLRRGHGLWCYRLSGRILVSYVTFKGDITVVHSASAGDEPRIIEGAPAHSITILGKVVWLGESVPLMSKVG